MEESHCWPPETSTRLLIGSTPIQNKKLKKKEEALGGLTVSVKLRLRHKTKMGYSETWSSNC